MKRSTVILLCIMVFAVWSEKVFASDWGGVVTAVDATKGTLTLEKKPNGHWRIGADFVCTDVSLIKNVETGQHLKVTYEEIDGKKVITSVTLKRRTGLGTWE